MRATLLAIWLIMTLDVTAAAGAQTLQQQIASDVIAQGWWDESGSLPPTEMRALVERWGDRMAFVYTDREFAVEGEPSLDPVPILAQSVLEELQSAGSDLSTVLMVSGSSGGGASTEFAYPVLVQAFQGFERDDVIGSFDSIAEQVSTGELDAQQEYPGTRQDDSGTTFSGGRIAVIAAIAGAFLVLAYAYASRKRWRERQSRMVERTAPVAESGSPRP